MISRTRHPLLARVIAGLVLVHLALPTVLLLDLGLAEATPIQKPSYPRTVRNFGTEQVSLSTHGYINDDCLYLLASPCFTKASPTLQRLEYTAAAQAIQRLAAVRNDFPGYQDLDWEVGPGSETPNADDTDPCQTSAGADPSSTAWRIDIVVNHLRILEVKRWGSMAVTPTQVDSELDCYLVKAGGVGINSFERSTELNGSGSYEVFDYWVSPFIDQTLQVYCVWADPNGLAHAGNVYFGPYSDPAVPAQVKRRCYSDPDQDPPANPVLVPDPVTAVKWALAALLVILGAEAVRRWGSPQPIPGYQRLNATTCEGLWTVLVLRASTPLTLKMRWGDGTSSTATVPAGSGFLAVQLSHIFPQGEATYKQAAEIVEIENAGFETVAYHPPPPSSGGGGGGGGSIDISSRASGTSGGAECGSYSDSSSSYANSTTEAESASIESTSALSGIYETTSSLNRGFDPAVCDLTP